jgi:hypothetical protein
MAMVLAVRLVYLVEQERWKEALSILDDLRIEIEVRRRYATSRRRHTAR